MKNRHHVHPDERTHTIQFKKSDMSLIKPLAISKIKTVRNFIGQKDQVLQKINCKKKKGMGEICNFKEI